MPQKVVLHVGCGPYHPMSLHETFRNDEWKEVRLDLNPKVKPDIVADITDMHPVKSASVHAVWSSHNLEHLYSHMVESALQEFYRVLTPGGFALVTMPDIQVVARHVAEGNLEEVLYQSSTAGPISAVDILWGHREAIRQGNVHMVHKTGFTAKTLRQKLEAVGFSVSQLQEIDFSLWAVGWKRADDTVGQTRDE